MVYTMRDVATRAGVSPATVSRVLNKTHYISDETKKRVLEVVEELNYYKNVHARRLSTGQSDLFGLVIPRLPTPTVLNSFAAFRPPQGPGISIFSS